MLFAVLLAALCHECGHVIAIYALGGRLAGLSISPGGLTLRRAGLGSYKSDCLVALAGPLAGLLLFLFFRQLFPLFAEANLALSLFNLCPIASLDGGRVLFALLSWRRGEAAATHALRRISFFTLLLLWGVTVFFLIEFTESLSLFLLTLWLFASLFLSGRQ